MHRDCFYSSFCRSVAVQYGRCQPGHPDADDVAGAAGWAPGHGGIRDGHKRKRLRLATVQRRLDGLRSHAPGNQNTSSIHVDNVLDLPLSSQRSYCLAFFDLPPCILFEHVLDSPFVITLAPRPRANVRGRSLARMNGNRCQDSCSFFFFFFLFLLLVYREKRRKFLIVTRRGNSVVRGSRFPSIFKPRHCIYVNACASHRIFTHLERKEERMGVNGRTKGRASYDWGAGGGMDVGRTFARSTVQSDLWR